ncbi:uncharacterized protein AMSG_11191, partial [Thecamonas trahens ATCC 50062]
ICAGNDGEAQQRMAIALHLDNAPVAVFDSAYDASVEPERLLADAVEVFVDESFFIAADAAPRVWLEAFAKHVFNAHTARAGLRPGIDYDPAASGAEWWVQIRHPPSPDRSACRHDEPDNSIGFHHDKDEELIDAGIPLNLTPHLSTVTYVSDAGAPTLVLPIACPPDYGEEDSVYGAYASGWAVYPHARQHMVFDGRLLHGVPADMVPSTAPASTRCTILVNIWLDYTPTGLRALPQDAVDALDLLSVDDGPTLALGEATPATDLVLASVADLQTRSYTHGNTGTEHTLTLSLPAELPPEPTPRALHFVGSDLAPFCTYAATPADEARPSKRQHLP